MKACPKETTLAALASGRLTPTRAQVVRAHAANCPSCAGTLEDFNELAIALRPLAQEPGAERSPEQIRAAEARGANAIMAEVAITSRRQEMIRNTIVRLSVTLLADDQSRDSLKAKLKAKWDKPAKDTSAQVVIRIRLEQEVQNLTAEVVGRLLSGAPVDERHQLARAVLSFMDRKSAPWLFVAMDEQRPAAALEVPKSST